MSDDLLGLGNPCNVPLSQMHTDVGQCCNDSQRSQTHPFSCQGPIDGTVLHQQAKHPTSETYRCTHKSYYPPVCFCLYQCILEALAPLSTCCSIMPDILEI